MNLFPPSDSAIDDPEQDLLGRRNFAKAIADLISDTASGQTMRIGIYGEWGEGKTSVLKLIERYLGDACIAIWVHAWTAADAEEILEGVFFDLASALRVDVAGLISANKIEEALDEVRKLADKDQRTKLAELFIGARMEKWATARTNKAREAVVTQIHQALHGRKVVVFVDDVDRVREDRLPEILLSLREVLDKPDYFYVIATSPHVADVLSKVFPAAGANFLEKIIELPRRLPPIREEDFHRFADACEKVFEVEAPPDALRAIRALLPRNPRQLKIFFRFLSSLRSLLSRFDADEIDWIWFLQCLIFRIEFPTESLRVATAKEAVDEIRTRPYVRLAAERDKKEPSPKYYFSPNDPIRHARYREIYDALGEHLEGRGDYKLEDLLMLADDPPPVTRREFRRMFAVFAAAQSNEKDEVIHAFLTEGPGTPPARTRSAFRLLLIERQSAMLEVIDNDIPEDFERALSSISQIDDFLTRFVLLKPFVVGGADVSDLINHFGGWAHFRGEEYGDLRSRERELLKQAIKSLETDVVVQLVNDWHFRFPNIGATNDFLILLKELENQLRTKLAETVLDRMENEDEALAFVYRRESRSITDAIFEPDSPLHTSAHLRERFRRLAKSAERDRRIQMNFVDLFDKLLYGVMEGGGEAISYVGSKTLIGTPEFLGVVWSAVVSRPLQPRRALTLVADRDKLITAGVSPETLPSPSWLTKLVQP